MGDVYLNTIQDFNDYNGMETLHPLVSVLHVENTGHMNDDTLTVAMVSDRLGFDYPQHFVRFFKAHTGKTPSAYRKAS